MNQVVRLEPMSPEDAEARITAWLRNQLSRRQQRAQPALQFSLRSIIQAELQSRQRELSAGSGVGVWHLDETQNTHVFYEAAWDMVRRGVLIPAMTLRPGEEPRFTGHEFRVTEYGIGWLPMHAEVDVLPTQYTRFGKYLQSHAHRFRPSYHTRSQEALGCYRAGMFMATCSMAGAAAESILLSLAVAASADEAVVLKEYRTSKGATKLRNRLSQGGNAYVTRELDNLLDLLKYWRDEASHASVDYLDEEAAFQALLLLGRLARFADRRWYELTQRRSSE